MTLRVGDIVICHGYDVVEGMRGFVEEIVSDPALDKKGMIWTGRYSVYGLEAVEFSAGCRHYFGDFLGANLEETGVKMSVKDLEQFSTVDSTDKMLQQDIPIVINNLGRESGRNKGSKNIWKLTD